MAEVTIHVPKVAVRRFREYALVKLAEWGEVLGHSWGTPDKAVSALGRIDRIAPMIHTVGWFAPEDPEQEQGYEVSAASEELEDVVRAMLEVLPEHIEAGADNEAILEQIAWADRVLAGLRHEKAQVAA
jgi:hypothetical protein